MQLSDSEVRQIVDNIRAYKMSDGVVNSKKEAIAKAENRMSVIDKAISKLYIDNAEGRLSDIRMNNMLKDLNSEYQQLSFYLDECNKESERERDLEENVDKFFNLVRQYTHIDTLTRDILLTFVDRIEIGEKAFPEGVKRNTHLNQPFKQDIKIYYKFIENDFSSVIKDFPLSNADCEGFKPQNGTPTPHR